MNRILIQDLLKNLTDEQITKGNEYFAQFLDPIIDEQLGQQCAFCGSYITGTLGLSNFLADLDGVNRHCFCVECGHPARHLHDIPGVGRLENLPLQFVHRVKIETAQRSNIPGLEIINPASLLH